MYFNPSWSHAHSAFTVALFLWYWHETRLGRTTVQWLLLALISGLMLTVYYPNAMLLMVLVSEALLQYRAAIRREPSAASANVLLARHALFAAATLVCLLPTFITRAILYGGPFSSGYIPLRYWLWNSPVFLQVLFSTNHGLLIWTPILLLSFIGLLLFARQEAAVGVPFLLALLAFYAFISIYPDWAGISSFGNRFFISLTPLFVLGLGVLLNSAARLFASRRAFNFAASIIVSAFVLWNLGLIFQWGTHLVPARGPVDFPQVISNQFTVVPRAVFSRLRAYFFRRSSLMQQIEEGDEQQRRQSPPPD
jgi:hypothetical protein